METADRHSDAAAPQRSLSRKSARDTSTDDNDIGISVTDSDLLYTSLHDTATANDLILSSQDVAFNSEGLHHKYFIYSLPFDPRVVDLCSIIGFLSAPFSRKAKLTIFETQSNVKHQLRFLPLVEIYVPAKEVATRAVSRQGSRADSTPRSARAGRLDSIEPRDADAPQNHHPADHRVFSFRVAVGDGYYDLLDTIRENRRITEKGILKWTVQVLETIIFAHRQYITLGDWSASDVRILSDDSILEAYQEVRHKLYREDSLNPTKASGSRPPTGETRPKTPQTTAVAATGGDVLAMEMVQDGREKTKFHRSVTKGRVSRDAWLFFHRHLNLLSSEKADGATMPSLYPTLKEFDPTCSGMSRIRYSEAAYQRWQRERNKYLEGMMMDFRTLGIVVCQLVSRRVFSTIELEQFRKKSFTYDLFASTISLDKYPLALCDLMRCCFQQSPYEVGYTVEDDSSGGAGSLYSGGTSILSAEQRFMKDLNIPQQLKTALNLCSALKSSWSHLEGVPWGQYTDIKEIMAAKDRIAGWSEEREKARIDAAIERQKRNDELVERGRHEAAARVTAQITRVMFDMKTPQEQRRIVERENRRKETMQRMRRRAYYIHRAGFHFWTQEEMANWCTKAVLKGFQHLRELLIVYKPKKEHSKEMDKSNISAADSSQVPTTGSVGSIRLPSITTALVVDWSSEPLPEEGSKKDVAEKRLVLETLSSFSRISKRVQVLVDQKSSFDITEDNAYSKRKPKSKTATKRARDDSGADSGGSDNDDGSSMGTREINSDGEDTVTSSSVISAATHGKTNITDNGSKFSASEASNTVPEKETRSPAHRLIKMRRLLGLMDHKLKKPNQALERLKKKPVLHEDVSQTGDTSSLGSTSDSKQKQPAWAQPFQRKLTQQEIEAKQDQTYSFLGSVVGKYLSTRSAPPANVNRSASHQLAMHLSDYLKAATNQMMNNDIVKWLPVKEIAVKVKFTAADQLVKKWTELRECLTALAKRCDMLEGIFEWVSSIARGVIMSMIDLYLADKPDRETGEEYAAHRLVAHFRMIVVRNKYRRIWETATSRATGVLRQQEELKAAEQRRNEKSRQRKEAAMSDAMGRAKMLQSTLDGGDINLDSLVEGMLLEADSGNVEDLPWIFSRELVPSANPSRRPQTVLAAPRRLASRPPHRVMRQMDEEIQMRLREVCGPYTCECSSTDRVRPPEHQANSSFRQAANVNMFFSDVVLAVEESQDEAVASVPPDRGVYIIDEDISTAIVGNTGMQASLVETLRVAHPLNAIDREMGCVSSEDIFSDQYVPTDRCKSVAETSTASLIFGFDFTSSSWGLVENMSHIGAEVYVDLSEQTSGAAPGHTRLVVVVDEIERLKYASASVVLDAISRNDSKIDGKVERSLAFVSAAMAQQREPLLHNHVSLQSHGVNPCLRWREVPYKEGLMQPEIDKVQQNLMVTRQNSELLSFMSDISDDPAPNGPNLTGPQKIRIAREAMRQSKRQGTAVLSKKQIEQVEYNTAIDAAVKELQEQYAGWTCLQIDIPGLVPGLEYNIQVFIGSQLKPAAKYRGLGVRLPPSASPEPRYQRVYLAKGLKLPAIYDRCSLVATSLAAARKEELDKVDLDAVDIFMVDRHSVQLLENQNGPSSGEPVDDADYNVKKGVLLRVPSTVPNRPEKLKIEVRRGTTAVDDRYKRKTSPSDAVIDQTQESRPLLINVRLAWTPSVHNGCSVQTYEVRRRLSLYISRELYSASISTSPKEESYLLHIDKGSWVTIADAIIASHLDVPSCDDVVPKFNIEKYTNKTRYFSYLKKKSSVEYDSLCGCKQNAESTTGFTSPGCAFTDSIDELELLMRSMTGESFWHIKDTLADTCDGFKAFRAFVVAEYSVRSRNAVGPSQWSEPVPSFVTEHGKTLSFIYRLNRERSINRGANVEEYADLEYLESSDRELESTTYVDADFLGMENVLTAAIDHFPEPDTKPRAKKAAKGIPHGVYNHASAVLIKGNFVDDILVEGNRGLRVPLLLENYAGGDSSKEMIDTENEEHDIKTEVECSVKEASQSGSSFLARLAKASPLVHSQPIDQVELEGFVALPSHLQRNAHNEVMTGTAGKIEHSRNVGILNRFQQFSETKDISFVAEGKMKNYQKRV